MDENSELENGFISSPENQELQDRLHQIFTRCEKLLEQAEFVFPEDRSSGTQTDEQRLEQYGTIKNPSPSFVFIYPSGRNNHIFGERTRGANGKIVRTDEFWQIRFSFELGLKDRLRLGLPKDVALEMKRLDDGKIDAQIIDFSPQAMGKLLKGKGLSSILPQSKILEKCVGMLSESPSQVTDYLKKDIRTFSPQQ